MLIPLWALGILLLTCCVFMGFTACYFKQNKDLVTENQELHRKLAVLDSKKPNRETLRAADAMFRELKVLVQPYTTLAIECVDNVHFVLLHRKGGRSLVKFVVNNSSAEGGVPFCIIHFLDSREVGGECVKSVRTTEVGAELMQLLSKFQRVSATHQLLAYVRE
jgi:hypothetical protein